MAIFSDSLIYNLIFILIILVLSIYLYLSSTFNYWKDRGVPFVKPVVFFGNLKNQFLSKKHFAFVYQDIYDELKGCRYGGYFEMRRPALMIRDPELVQQILVKDFTHFYNRGMVMVDSEYDPLSGNLFNLEGGHWKFLRNKLTPTFTTGKLKGMFEQIYNCAEELNKSIEEQSKKQKGFEIKPLLSNYSLEVIASCGFGLQIDENDEMTKTFKKVISRFFATSKLQTFQTALYFFWPKLGRIFGLKSVPPNTESVIIQIIKDTIKFREDNKIIRNDFLQLILNLKNQEESGNLQTKFDVGVDKDADDDIIDQMKYTSKDDDEQQSFKANEKAIFTEACIAAQSFVFLLAGAEAVATPLAFALYETAKNPKVQEKVHNVIDSVLEKHNHQWSYQAVRDMTYIDQILQETFRIHPNGILLIRQCTKAYKIPGSNDVIEKGSRVTIPIHAIHNDPNNFKSADVFDPDRFIDNNFKPNGAFLPFGDGPRICIAMRFAVLEMRVAFAKILSQYNIKINSKTKSPIKYVINSPIPLPEGGFWFEFEKRKPL